MGAPFFIHESLSESYRVHVDAPLAGNFDQVQKPSRVLAPQDYVPAVSSSESGRVGGSGTEYLNVS